MKGDDLRQWRKRMGFKQADAAAALGVPARTYQRWERAASVDRVVELATQALTVHAAWQALRKPLSDFSVEVLALAH